MPQSPLRPVTTSDISALVSPTSLPSTMISTMILSFAVLIEEVSGQRKLSLPWKLSLKLKM